jgi:hypothetical protein
VSSLTNPLVGIAGRVVDRTNGEIIAPIQGMARNTAA